MLNINKLHSQNNICVQKIAPPKKFPLNRDSNPHFPFYINLVALLFCLFLGACGVKSNSRSSNSNSSSEEEEEVLPKDCKVENGVTELRNGQCEVIACDAGFDNQEDNSRCQATIARYYSPAGSNDRTACTKPDDSSWTTTTGLTSLADCATQAWTCNDAGFDNQEDNSRCQATLTGYYSPAGSNGRTACPSKPDDSSWTSGTRLAAIDECEWACNSGFDNQEDNSRCQATIARYYSPAGSNDRTACTKPDDSSWTTTTGLTSLADCATQAWTCNDAGFDNQEDNSRCQATLTGYYSPAGSNGRTACPSKPDDSSWTSGTRLAAIDECEWACNSGFDNQEDNSRCQATIARYYSPAGSNDRTACTKPDDSSWTTTTGLTSLADCATQAWTCNDAGFDNQEDNSRCQATLTGYYSPAGSNGRTACPSKPDDSSWTSGTRLAAIDECEWACNSGFDNQEDNSRCQATIARYYSPAGSNDRTACTKPDDSSWTTTTGLTSLADCATQAWTCNDAGFDNQEDNSRCQATLTGYYSPAGSNGRTACPSKPDDSSWTSGTRLAAIDECEWACNSGFDNQEDNSRCQATLTGYYSPAGSNDRTACTKPDDSSWTSGTGLAAIDECEWACNSGFDNQEDNSRCQATLTGYYSPAGSNDRTACTKPDDSSWTSGTGLAAINECEWACNINYYKSKNSNACFRTKTAITAGASHTCAILSDNTVKCWGDNTYGQLGTAAGIPDLGGKDATHIAAGWHYTCVILADKSVHCWGRGDDGMTTPNLGSKKATHIAGGIVHTCVILVDKSVYCWGHNEYGRLTPNLGGKAATHIAAGHHHSCVILADKSVHCWGQNKEGKITPNLGSNTATQIAVGYYHTCAILDDDGDVSNGGPVSCWGANTHGEATPNLGGKEATHITAGLYHTCAILEDESVKCWGQNKDGRITPNLGSQDATHIAAGWDFNCAILADGSVQCWGLWFYGYTLD